jgi:protein SCO1/2
MNYSPRLAALALCATALVISPSGAADKPSCCNRELPAAKCLPERSLYQLTSSWTNDASEALMLDSLRGRPQIVTMFFASCEFACPILVRDMKHIEAALPETVRTNVGFVLISFDSRRDTPAVLANYRKLYGLNSNWTLLLGGPDDVLELAALLGVKYKKDARGQFAHSNLITLLNSNGEIAARQIGLSQDGEEFVSNAKRLLAPGKD